MTHTKDYEFWDLPDPQQNVSDWTLLSVLSFTARRSYRIYLFFIFLKHQLAMLVIFNSLSQSTFFYVTIYN